MEHQNSIHGNFQRLFWLVNISIYYTLYLWYCTFECYAFWGLISFNLEQTRNEMVLCQII